MINREIVCRISAAGYNNNDDDDEERNKRKKKEWKAILRFERVSRDIRNETAEFLSVIIGERATADLMDKKRRDRESEARHVALSFSQ